MSRKVALDNQDITIINDNLTNQTEDDRAKVACDRASLVFREHRHIFRQVFTSTTSDDPGDSKRENERTSNTIDGPTQNYKGNSTKQACPHFALITQRKEHKTGLPLQDTTID